MPTLPYLCTATPLTATAFQAALTTLGIDAPTLCAILAVETSGSGFYADRRPQVRFERQVFSRATNHRYDASHPTISNKKYGYGPTPWAYLAQAITLDQPDALASASWGLGQVMGNNFALGGYPDVETMVAAMCASEDNQLALAVSFILHNGLQTALQQHDWTAYASRYNGSSYRKNQYDTRLAAAYAKYTALAAQPDLNIRAAQIYLEYLGYDPKGIDGQLGADTLTALHNFQSHKGYTLTPSIDATVLSTLVSALPPPVDLSLA